MDKDFKPKPKPQPKPEPKPTAYTTKKKITLFGRCGSISVEPHQRITDPVIIAQLEHAGHKLEPLFD